MNTSKQIAHTLWRLVTLQGQPVSVVAGRFAVLIHTHHLENVVPVVLRYLKMLGKQTAQDRTLKLVTSHKVNDELIGMIRNQIKVPIEERVTVTVESELLGGFIAEYNHQVHDASLRRHLRDLEKALTN